MFTLIKANLVQSDEGFSVKTTGWEGIVYTQQGKTLHVDSEFLVGPDFNIVVWGGGIKKWDSGDDIGDSERRIIVDNIVRALHFRNLKVDIKW
jgi:hypothetical protein